MEIIPAQGHGHIVLLNIRWINSRLLKISFHFSCGTQLLHREGYPDAPDLSLVTLSSLTRSKVPVQQEGDPAYLFPSLPYGKMLVFS